MKRKIVKYLKLKEESQYTFLDDCLKNYINGGRIKYLANYKFSKIEIFPEITKNKPFMEICLIYQNIACNIAVMEDELEYSVYPLYADIDEVNKNTFNIVYKDNFSFDELINEVYNKMINHYKLKDISNHKNKQKIYSLIANICLLFPFISVGSIVVYGYIVDTKIVGNIWWGIFLIVIPLVLHIIFNVKSKK